MGFSFAVQVAIAASPCWLASQKPVRMDSRIRPPRSASRKYWVEHQAIRNHRPTGRRINDSRNLQGVGFDCFATKPPRIAKEIGDFVSQVFFRFPRAWLRVVGFWLQAHRPASFGLEIRREAARYRPGTVSLVGFLATAFAGNQWRGKGKEYSQSRHETSTESSEISNWTVGRS